MMMLNTNKQNMYYALQIGKIPVYETDDAGNIIYVEVDGVNVPVETGDYTLGYEIPVEMQANISYQASETVAQEFGVNIADYDAIIVYDRKQYPLTETSLIWFESEPTYQDENQTIINEKSADYKVVSVRNTLNESKAILKHLTK